MLTGDYFITICGIDVWTNPRMYKYASFPFPSPTVTSSFSYFHLQNAGGHRSEQPGESCSSQKICSEGKKKQKKSTGSVWVTPRWDLQDGKSKEAFLGVRQTSMQQTRDVSSRKVIHSLESETMHSAGFISTLGCETFSFSGNSTQWEGSQPGSN